MRGGFIPDKYQRIKLKGERADGHAVAHLSDAFETLERKSDTGNDELQFKSTSPLAFPSFSLGTYPD